MSRSKLALNRRRLVGLFASIGRVAQLAALVLTGGLVSALAAGATGAAFPDPDKMGQGRALVGDEPAIGVAPEAAAGATQVTGSITSVGRVPAAAPYRMLLPNNPKGYRFPVLDDFSDASSGWPSGSDEVSQVGYTNGEYRILIKQANYYVWVGGARDVRDFSAAVDAHTDAPAANDAYGIVFGAASSNFYRLEAYPTSGHIYLRLKNGNTTTTLVDLSSSAVAKTGTQTNRLKVTRRGATMTVSVNGQVVGSASDATLGSGYLGLWAVNGAHAGFDARFDNFRATFGTSDGEAA